MSLLNTAMNVVGTVAAVKSLFGNAPSSGATGKYNEFLSEIRQASVARTTHFEVIITPPPILAGDGAARKLSLYAQGSALPGMNIQTTTVKRYGFGANYEMPREAQTTDLTVNFIGDGKGEIYKFFYKWMQGISASERPEFAEQYTYNGLKPYEVEFRENYASTINVVLFNEQLQAVMEYELIGAFPKTLPDVSLSWDGGQFMTFPVIFSFTHARLLSADTTFNGNTTKFELSPFQKLAKIGTAIQVLSSLKKPQSIGDAINVARNAKGVFSGISSVL